MFSRVRSSRTGDPRVLRCTLDALARRRNAELDEDLEANPRRDDVSLLRIRVWGSLRVVDDSCDACLLYVALQCVHMGNKEMRAGERARRCEKPATRRPPVVCASWGT